MSTIIYPGGCTEEDLQHYCSDCPDAENGRVRHLAFVHTSYTFTDYESQGQWQTGIQDNLIKIIANVRGTYTGGEPVLGPGFGDIPQKKTGTNFKLNVTDPNFLLNCPFYNALANSFNWRVAWCSATVFQISDKACLVVPKDPIEETVESERYWQLEISFSQKSIPCHKTIPANVFQCLQTV